MGGALGGDSPVFWASEIGGGPSGREGGSIRGTSGQNREQLLGIALILSPQGAGSPLAGAIGSPLSARTAVSCLLREGGGDYHRPESERPLRRPNRDLKHHGRVWPHQGVRRMCPLSVQWLGPAEVGHNPPSFEWFCSE